MATLFANLPVPAGDGVGAGVDVSTMGATRTVAVKGTFTGTVTVEISNDGGTTYVPLHSFTEIKQKTFLIAAQYMRVRRSGVVVPAGTPNVDVGGDDIGSSFANLPVTAGDGTGAGVDISALGTFNTIAVSGTFTGSVAIEISLDNVDWLPLLGFEKAMAQSKRFIAQYARVVRSGVGTVPGTPIVNIGAANDPIGTAGIGLDRTIIVAKVGGDANTIEAGIAAALALTPPVSAANPATVQVYPGDYTENPLTVPAGCTLQGQGLYSTTIRAAVATQPLVSLTSECLVSDFRIEGATGVGGYGVYFAGGILGLAAGIRDLAVFDCTTAYYFTGATTSVFGFNCAAIRGSGDAMTDGFVAAAGAVANISNPQVVAVPPVTIARGAVATGAGSTLDLFSMNMTRCVVAVEADATAEVHCVSGKMEDSGTQFHITATGGIIHATGVGADDTTLYGVHIEAANGTFEGSANAIRSDQINVAAGANFLSTHISRYTGDLSQMVIGELGVGLPNFPSESIFGEGDSHVREMAVLRNTNLEAGAWTDITTEMSSSSGSTADAFAGVGIGQCLYIGGSEKQFPGAKIKTTAAIVLGAGSLAWEYWNGAAWTAFTLMTADSVTPYASYAEDTFGRINFEQVRFDASNFVGWAQKALNGTTKWWVRCRQVAAITTSPTLEQIKLHTNRTEINADGIIEHFGSAIDVRPLSFSIADMVPFSGGGAPGNANIVYTANITLSPQLNVLADNAFDGRGAVVTLPQGIDTGQPVTMRWNWIPALLPGAGEIVRFLGHFGVINEGDILDGSVTDTAWIETVLMTGILQDEVLQTEVEFDISDLVAGEQLVFTLSRDATGGSGDTFVGNVELSTVELFGYFWR